VVRHPPFLPKGKPVTFLAKAFNSSNTLLFSGSTDQTLTADNQVVTLTLAPINDGQTITLPRITRITIPGAFPQDKRGNISFSVSATTGEKLSYVINGAAGGGSFMPQRGSITLLAACRHLRQPVHAAAGDAGDGVHARSGGHQ
jgi:hypothetical protein